MPASTMTATGLLQPHEPIPETVTLRSDVVLDAIAALHALDDYFTFLDETVSDDGYGGSDTSLGDWALNQASALQNEAFGRERPALEGEDEDLVWHTWPVEVERFARAAETFAEILRLHVEDAENREGGFATFRERMRKAQAKAVTIRTAQNVEAS